MSHCCVRVGMPVEGPARCTSKITAGNLGEIGEAEELLHQRDAGAGGRGEGARAVPGGADHHADRGELVLGLDDGVAVLLGCRIDAVARGNGAVKASASEEEGVIGYQAHTVAPP